MKANELRLGNIVSASSDTAEVMGIYPTGVNLLSFPSVDQLTFNHLLELIEGVPLTKEWLVKLGFKDNSGGYFQDPELNFFIFHVEEDDYFECYKQVEDGTDDFKTLQHVHKLQNLYFELFDEELEIKA